MQLKPRGEKGTIVHLRIVTSFALAGLVAATPVLAADPEVDYPAHTALHPSGWDSSPIVTPEATYDGPHPVFAKALPALQPWGAIAQADDGVEYPTADAPAQPAAEPRQAPQGACSCPCR